MMRQQLFGFAVIIWCLCNLSTLNRCAFSLFKHTPSLFFLSRLSCLMPLFHYDRSYMPSSTPLSFPSAHFPNIWGGEMNLKIWLHPSREVPSVHRQLLRATQCR